MTFSQILKDHCLFLGRFLRNPVSIGSLVPSSTFLAKAMAESVVQSLSADDYVLEVGAGTGSLTQGLLQYGVNPERLICLESDANLVKILKGRFKDLSIVNGNVCFLREIVPHLEKKVGAVVSGLPLRNFSMLVKEKIVKDSFFLMKEKGLFYQFTYGYKSPLKGFDLREKKFAFVWRNFPPASLWCYARQDHE